jgi:DNA-binding NtrC family response regulator
MGNSDDDVPAPEEAGIIAVILIEDEVLLRALIAEELREAGYKVIEFASADPAWQYMNAGGHADVVITDITMPGRLQGDELDQLIETSFPGVLVILMSGYPAAAKSLRGPHFLHKPFQIEDAIQLINKSTVKKRI